jgi:hypothetical protein
LVAGGGHAEGGREGGARVSGSVAVVLALGAGEESVEALVLADRREAIKPTGEEFVDVALVAYVEEEFVGGGFEDAVEGDGEFHDSEVGAEVAAGVGEDTDEFVADLVGEFRQFLGKEVFEIGRRVDFFEKRAGFESCGHGALF